jgi:NAD(P)-dependent dehydrogenase (short-subunit alcohol dehydrogenase family)
MVVRRALGGGLDQALDRAVVPGYTRAGYLLRRRFVWPGTPAGAPLPRLDGRTVLITGAGTGLGEAAAVALARRGAELVLLVRAPARAERARSAISAAAPGAAVELAECDLSDLDSVRAAAGALPDRVDALIHNAGVLPARRELSAQGHEITLATHVLGPILLTELLRPALRGGRVVFVSSGGMYSQSLAADDPEYTAEDYRGATAYARTKRMQVALTPLLARRWPELSVYATHPGWADTPGVASSLPGFHRLLGPVLRSPEQGADTAVWLAAAAPAPPKGGFWHDRAERPEHYLPLTRYSDDRLARLWRYVAHTVGIPPMITSG